MDMENILWFSWAGCVVAIFVLSCVLIGIAACNRMLDEVFYPEGEKYHPVSNDNLVVFGIVLGIWSFTLVVFIVMKLTG